MAFDGYIRGIRIGFDGSSCEGDHVVGRPSWEYHGDDDGGMLLLI